jgi:hypothetical protein
MFTLLTVIPAPLIPMVAPATKFVPVRVTGTLVPRTPALGLIETRVGIEPVGVMLKVAGPLVPPAVVTVTLKDPAEALSAIVNVAAI